MIISSPDFKNNQKIPIRFTGDRKNINPNLIIENIPKDAKSLVLIVDDPDFPGGWDHWIVFNIKITNRINENSIPGIQGKNTYGKINYMGPRPPSGTHRYFFRIYALDCMLNLKIGSNREELEKVMGGHILEKAELIGLYR
ncbi:MAG: YbhB/YbcL family Raf kinase inhibitor-like protein [Candidatus Nanoarchaeia archaeon]|nr:YbhB/YbcL family Raf kinase inhibitor-like protein [Candidatus Nanoarchaeia archaeon]MDD5741345.1 YbhB/YbcL family Raf kinase inhibitor-like protein [Candidatus Nanoarchaeia archaeon]